MELRTTESKVNELIFLYKSLQESIQKLSLPGDEMPQWPELVLAQETTTTTTTTTADNNNKNDTITANNNNNTTQLQLPEISKHFDDILSIVNTELAPKMSKFQQRLQEKDPVTGNPRYGEKTKIRVETLLQHYNQLYTTLQAVPIDSLHQLVQTQQLQLQKQQQEQELKQQQEQELLKQQQLQLQQQEQAAQQAVQQEQARQEAELHARAQAVRQQAQEQRRAERDAERQWMESITKGPNGVIEQIQILKQSTKHNVIAQQKAISSLKLLFQQIVAHPEEVNFRRVRRDHEQFHADIGQYQGGIELLIAAGFVLGEIDGVPSFISKEPNIETDMDGWANWFDTLKATLEILQKEEEADGKKVK